MVAVGPALPGFRASSARSDVATRAGAASVPQPAHCASAHDGAEIPVRQEEQAPAGSGHATPV
jgi:hypothetical protein